MPDPVKDAPAAKPAGQGNQNQQPPPADKSKESNAEKIAKAQQGAAQYLAKKLIESSKAKPPENKDESEGGDNLKDEKKIEPEDKADEKKPEPKSEDKSDEKAEAKPDPKSKPERKKPTEADRKEVSTDDIAEAAARGVAKVLQGGKHPNDEKAEPKKYTKDDLPQDFAEVYDELLELPKLGGEWKGRDIVAEVVEHSRAIEKYKATWQKKNKGQEFDPSDEEHAEFFAEHSIEIPQQALIRAARSVAENNAKNAAVEKVREELGGDIEEIRAQKKLAALRPVVERADSSVDEAIASAVGDDVVAALKKGGDEVRKLADSHPYLSEVVKDVTPIANGFAALAVKVISGVEKFDPKKHAQLRDDILSIEAKLDAMDNPPKLDDGREFISLKDFDGLSPQAQRRYYTVSDIDAIPIVVGTFAKTVADDVAGVWKSRHDRWLKANGGQSKESNGAPKDKQEQKQDHRPAPSVNPAASKISESKDEKKPKTAAAFMASVYLGKKP